MREVCGQSEGEAPFWGWCGYCGGRIRLGEDYYESEGLAVCAQCARRYAWMHFLLRSVKRTAETRGPI